MADEKKRLDSNVAGNFFVDATCINCDTCRQLAPTSFEEVGKFSAVTIQPIDDGPTHQAYQALLACPVGSIGTEHSDKLRLKDAMASFPVQLEDEVSYCGFNSEKSFGANSFFIEHPDGNWLIDSPRYLKHLVEAFEQRGGIAYIFLTHKDDVADHQKFHDHFKCRRVIHINDVEEGTKNCEVILETDEPTVLKSNLFAIPTPGHTSGHMCLLFLDRYLFTGDHLFYNRDKGRVYASKNVNWFSWDEQIKSNKKLLDYHFEWIFPGHGGWIHEDSGKLKEDINRIK